MSSEAASVSVEVDGMRKSFDAIDTSETKEASGWFARLLAAYLRRRTPKAMEGVNPSDSAVRAIRVAAAQSAVTGATAGMASTGATLFTAQTEGLGAFVAVPVAAAAIGAEMALRTLIHIDLICTMADIFGVRIDPDSHDDIWRLCALAFGAAEKNEDSSHPEKELVQELAHLEQDEVGKEIGHRVLGESVARNLLPVVGIGVSAVSNYRKTVRIGDTARRYMRYQRALSDALSQVLAECQHHFELVVEGIWFVFIADGQLAAEESACLAGLVRQLDRPVRERVLARFVEDEYDWLERIARDIQGDDRAAFFHAIEVAAAVDKKVGVPERRLLRSIARRLGLVFDPRKTAQMIVELEETGILEA